MQKSKFKEKLAKLIPNHKSLMSVGVLLLLILVVQIAYSIYDNEDIFVSLTNDYKIIIGLSVGVLIGTIFASLLLETLKINSLVVTLLFVIAIFAGATAYSVIYLKEVPGEIVSSALVGVIAGIIMHLLMSRTDVIPFIVAIMISTLVVTELNEDIETRTIIAISIVCFFMLFITWLRFIRYSIKYEIPKQEKNRILSVKKFLLLASIICIVAFASLQIGSQIIKVENDVKEAQQEQRIEIRRREENSPRDNNDLPFDERPKELTATLVGYYRAEEPTYLKTSVFDYSYDINGLSVSSALDTYRNYDKYSKESSYESYIGDEKNIIEPDLEILDKVQIVYRYAPSDKSLPTPGAIQYFEGQRYSENLEMFRASSDADANTAKLQFWFDSELYSGERLPEEDRFSFPGNTYTFVSPDSDRYEEVRELAIEITEDFESDFEKAKAIESYFNDEFIYSFFPEIEDQKSPIDDFILDTKKGYCTHFAAGMVYMLDTIGIEARMVGGYYADAFDPNLRAYVLTSDRLHAWVEVYINGEWIMFEPTTGNLSPDTEPYLVTGRNVEDKINYNEYLIKYDLQPVTGVVSFDSFFEEEKPTLPEGQTNTLEDSKDKWTSEEKKGEKIEKEAEDRETYKYIGKVVTYIIYTIGALFTVAMLYLLISYFVDSHRTKAQRRHRKTKKIIDENEIQIRDLLIKKNLVTVKDALTLSNKKLLLSVDKEYRDQLRNMYKLVDELLYSANPYSEAQFTQYKKEYKTLINRVKANKK